MGRNNKNGEGTPFLGSKGMKRWFPAAQRLLCLQRAREAGGNESGIP
jgi:hypothetical protein